MAAALSWSAVGRHSRPCVIIIVVTVIIIVTTAIVVVFMYTAGRRPYHWEGSDECYTRLEPLRSRLREYFLAVLGANHFSHQIQSDAASADHQPAAPFGLTGTQLIRQPDGVAASDDQLCATCSLRFLCPYCLFCVLWLQLTVL